MPVGGLNSTYTATVQCLQSVTVLTRSTLLHAADPKQRIHNTHTETVHTRRRGVSFISYCKISFVIFGGTSVCYNRRLYLKMLPPTTVQTDCFLSLAANMEGGGGVMLYIQSMVRTDHGVNVEPKL